MSYSFITQLLQDHAGWVAGTAVASASAGLFWWSTSAVDKAIEYPISLDDQSVEIEPGVRASKFAADGKFIEFYYEDAKTTYEAFTRGIRASKNGPCIGTRQPGSKEYVWVNYQTIYDRAQQLGSSFVHRGLQATDETFIGICAANCPEWVISEEACAMFSMAVVPLYDTLGSDACEYIINQTSMALVLCDKGPKAQMMVKSANRTPSLKTLIVFERGTLTDDIVEEGRRNNVDVISFDDMLDLGKRHLHKPVPPTQDTLCTICYTSGTTGNPKGVLVTHKAMMANTAAGLVHMQSQLTITPDDCHLAYLPLAHMFERLNQLTIYQHGARVGFSCGDIRLILEDLAALRPTAFPTVPRLLNRIYDKVQQGLAKSRIKSLLFKIAINRKMALLRRGIVTRNSIWDRLVFSRIQSLLGGRVRVCVVGSAPLHPNVLNFTRCALGCLVMEGYGQTEVTAAVTLTLPHEWQAGIVGPPIPCCHVKLVDIPEMDYYAKDGKGEVCIRGSCMMNGYYKDPEKTREVIDSDGWVHSGDVGQWTPNGALKIIDRRKHIFKLAQGEYLAPEKIESIYIRSPFIMQVFVDGDGLQTYAVAVVVPDKEVVLPWARTEFGFTGSMDELCNRQELRKAILDDITKRGKEAGLKGFEQAKDMYLTNDAFTVENDLLTPTFKSKRPSLRRHYAKQIADMYKSQYQHS